MSENTASDQITWRFGVRRHSETVGPLKGDEVSSLSHIQTTFSSVEGKTSPEESGI